MAAQEKSDANLTTIKDAAVALSTFPHEETPLCTSP